MNASFGSSTAYSIFIILIFVGIVCLQTSLSKSPNKWSGLILPIISFLISLNAVFGRVLFDNEKLFDTIIICLQIFLIYNISTLILLGIYLKYADKRKSRSQLEKMNIQDLE